MKKRLLSLLLALAVTVAAAPAALAANSGSTGDKTYTVTANLMVPGELNKQLPGVTAYMTNGNNPLGVGGYAAKAPTEPVSDNAKLTESANGTLTLVLPVPNPVFTLQSIGGGTNATITKTVRDSETYTSTDGKASRDGRITQLTITLNDRSGTYVFSDCVEFPTLLGVDWTVPLTLKVDLSALSSSSSTKSSFKDVASTAYYAKPVAWAVEKNVTTGTSSTTFSPNATCTRAQIITFLWRASGSPEPTAANPFSDVKSSDYYYKACVWAAEKGMASGSTFQPNANCTRAMAVEFMWKQAGSPSASAASFTDVSSSAAYSKAVAWAVQKGVTTGTSATTFSPSTTCTRGQIVTFLYRGLAE